MTRAPGLYLHVPFCATVCPYCDFAVLVGGEERRARFVDALIAEIELWARDPAIARFDGIDTIYFGGGTPSMLEPEQLARIVAAVIDRLPVGSSPTLFLEANPEDVSARRARAWRDLGVRFLSLGVQSFDDAELRFLGRLHDSARAREALELVLAEGFDTVSLDLIYGLPAQAESAWRRNLETALELEPDHLSCYQLTVHEGTAFGVRTGRGELVEMPEDGQAGLFRLTHRFLGDRGYCGYEVSNFARSEAHRSRHNSKYWDHTPYLGLGPSAHSLAGRRRWWNRRKLAAWQAAVEAREAPVEGSEELTDSALALERLMLGLRTLHGVDLGTLRDEYGLDLEMPERAGRVESLLARGLVILEGPRLRPTPDGLAIADALALELYGDA